jgi:hypothetical protein
MALTPWLQPGAWLNGFFDSGCKLLKQFSRVVDFPPG